MNVRTFSVTTNLNPSNFSGQNAVRKRRKVYSVNKSHYCPRCSRGFTLKKNMTRHLRHECGMAPKYQCPYCDKPSKFTQNIYAHIRKYHPGQALCFRRLYWITRQALSMGRALSILLISTRHPLLGPFQSRLLLSLHPFVLVFGFTQNMRIPSLYGRKAQIPQVELSWSARWSMISWGRWLLFFIVCEMA